MFDKCKFQIEKLVVYSGPRQCPNPSFPGEPEGLCLLHSRIPEKNRDGAFDAMVKEKLDREDYDFQGVFFPGPVSFSGHKFNREALFGYAHFSNGADFSRARFTEEAVFFETKFDGKTYWSYSEFNGKADFRYAIFSGEAILYESIFNREANFSRASITGRLILQSLNPPGAERVILPVRGDFRYLELQDKAVIRFQDLNLSRVEFAGTDLRRIGFHNITWHSYCNWFFRKDVRWLPIRQALYDEVLLDEKEPSLFCRIKNNIINIVIFWKWPYLNISKPANAEYARVEEIYRYLRINYEEKGDYKNAGDFHYGEMEMHRRANPWRRWVFVSWYNLYRFLSGYGERPLWALSWLVAFLAVFTGLLAWAGLDLDPKHIPAFGDSFFYLLQKVTLQRPTWAEPVGFGGKLVAGLSVLLIPGQAALFLLALRNRLGRRR